MDLCQMGELKELREEWGIEIPTIWQQGIQKGM